MADPTVGLRGITLVCVPTPTDGQDKAIEFYESIGFEKRTDTPMGDGYRWVEVYRPKVRPGSRWRPRRRSPARSLLWSRASRWPPTTSTPHTPG